MEQLTPREIEIARLVTAGKSYKRIGQQLGIEEDTVNKHVQSAAAKIGGSGSPKMRLVLFVIDLMRSDLAKKREAAS